MAVRIDKKASVVIRPAMIDDAQSMREIDQLCFEPGVAYDDDIFYYHLLIHHDPAFVVMDGEKMIGFVLTSVEEKGVGLIVTIDILAPWREQGHGTRLIKLAEEALRKRGAITIILQVAVENKPAIIFYEKHGYCRVKQLADYYGGDKHAYLFKKPVKRD